MQDLLSLWSWGMSPSELGNSSTLPPPPPHSGDFKEGLVTSIINLISRPFPDFPRGCGWD